MIPYHKLTPFNHFASQEEEPMRKSLKMSQHTRRLLAQRALVSPNILTLLRRAPGLDLLEPHDQQESIILDVPRWQMGPDDVYQGMVWDDSTKTFRARVLRFLALNFPAPGWYGPTRQTWDNIEPCDPDAQVANACMFPKACACY